MRNPLCCDYAFFFQTRVTKPRFAELLSESNFVPNLAFPQKTKNNQPTTFIWSGLQTGTMLTIK